MSAFFSLLEILLSTSRYQCHTTVNYGLTDRLKQSVNRLVVTNRPKNPALGANRGGTRSASKPGGWEWFFYFLFFKLTQPFASPTSPRPPVLLQIGGRREEPKGKNATEGLGAKGCILGSLCAERVGKVFFSLCRRFRKKHPTLALCANTLSKGKNVCAERKRDRPRGETAGACQLLSLSPKGKRRLCISANRKECVRAFLLHRPRDGDPLLFFSSRKKTQQGRECDRVPCIVQENGGAGEENAAEPMPF